MESTQTIHIVQFSLQSLQNIFAQRNFQPGNADWLTSKKATKCWYDRPISSTPHISRMECIASVGAPTSTVLQPNPDERMGPIVLPHAMSLFTQNSWLGMPRRRPTSLKHSRFLLGWRVGARRQRSRSFRAGNKHPDQEGVYRELGCGSTLYTLVLAEERSQEIKFRGRIA